MSGFRNRQSKTTAGVKKIELIEANQIAEVEIDYSSGSCRSVELKAGGKFVSYCFKEDRATYCEKVTNRRSNPLVVHTLSMLLERVDALSVGALRELVEASKSGLVGIVTLRGGEQLLVGYSDRMGAEQPLRVKEAETISGAEPIERSGVEIVLESVDCESAMIVLP